MTARVSVLRAKVGSWMVRFAERRLDGIEGLPEERRAWFRAELRRRHAEVFGQRQP